MVACSLRGPVPEILDAPAKLFKLYMYCTCGHDDDLHHAMFLFAGKQI